MRHAWKRRRNMRLKHWHFDLDVARSKVAFEHS